MITVGCDRATSLAAIDVAAHHDDVWATVGLHPHDAVNGVDSIVDLLDHAERRRRRRVRPRLLLRPFAARRAARRVRRADPARPRARAAAGDPHPRRVGRHVRRARTPRACRRSTIFHCFTGGPDEARRCLELGAFVSFSGIVTFKTRDRRPGGGARSCPLERLLVETDSAVPGARAASGAAEPAGLGAVRRRVRRRPARDRVRTSCRRATCGDMPRGVPRGGFVAPAS